MFDVALLIAGTLIALYAVAAATRPMPVSDAFSV